MNPLTKQFKKNLLLFTLLIFCGLTTNNKLCAQGPNAPEAASFEPVDATDMVNLVTGDLSYVLPLLNVPSPEGGYPIALSYHAGIAMEQEASWVGLGWSLNPGTINRGVNGYPDDWGKTNINEFFYDNGWTEDYYNFSAGVTFSGGVSVGLGLSWGSNKSLGGYVSASIGPEVGEEGPSIGGRIGTNGISINAALTNGLSASVGTNGVGIGYGPQRGESGIGMDLNYNYNYGLSGGVSYSTPKSSIGMNFSSNAVTTNGIVNGAGVSVTNYGVSSRDYSVEISSVGFYIPIYMFYVGYGHTAVKYSLFKYNNLYTSGILYPVLANELKPYQYSSNLSKLLYESNFMDVNIIPKYDETTANADLLDDIKNIDKNNLVLPNYDNYSVTAQGLSGSLKPYIHSELNLSGRGRGEQNNDNIYVSYLNHSLNEYKSAPSSGINVNRDAVRKLNFTFDNAYNSFLRMERTGISKLPYLPAVHSDYVMDYFETNETNSFNNYNSLTLLAEKRKRESNYIETFTNKQIRDSYNGQSVSTLLNFIDSKQYNELNQEINLDRSDTSIFLDDGIGAYQITTIDGKTYHYSLPVYNYETFYKNFKNENDEDENFLEIQKSAPYATHWLLTAVTGPDYVDINGNGAVDVNDYGYWVSFDYGKWSDGFGWKTPSGHYSINDNHGDKTYSYFWGRKQVYYLDAIKTRTHTALFIKDIRSDNRSNQIAEFENKWVLGSYDWNYNTKKITNETGGVFGYPGDKFYTFSSGEVTLPDQLENCWVYSYFANQKIALRYIDIPKNKSLRLRKILLLKNEDFFYDKQKGNMSNSSRGAFLSNVLYAYTYGNPYIDGVGFCDQYYAALYNNPISTPKEFYVDLDENILDLKDIEGLGLEAKAQQVIEFGHDYSLATNTPNSDAPQRRRLTLKSLNFNGRQGIALLPPYKFSYKNSTVQYNENDIDEWGYHKSLPFAWSLNEIQTPTGGKIHIDYESDSYYAEAAYSQEKIFDNITSLVVSGQNVTFNFGAGSPTVASYFKVGNHYDISYRENAYIENNGVCCNLVSTDKTGKYYVNAIGNGWITMTAATFGYAPGVSNYNNQNCGTNQYEETCITNLVVYGRLDDHSISDPNGKEGGGIRTKNITISDGINNIASSHYVYTNPTTNKISGITSYAPSDNLKGIPYVSELPPPMVTYGHVKMVNKDGNEAILGSSSYKFETLTPMYEELGFLFSLGDAFKVKENQDASFESNKVFANKYTISSSLGNIGRLLSVERYNNKEQKINIKTISYKTNLDGDGEIGVTQESHKSYKRVLKTSNLNEYFYISSTSRINYPSVIESTTTTQGGFTNTIVFNKHDFLTGQVLETTTTDSKGNEFKTELIPAYTKYGTGNYSMGSKVDNPTNKNMLAQEAMTKTYIKVDGQWKETGVGITTWNNDWSYTDYTGLTTQETAAAKKIWRKHKNYIWKGDLDADGTYIGFAGPDDNFKWGLGAAQTNSKWKNTSTTTRYDHYSMPLEVMDINNNYIATKTCDDDSKVLAVSNAKYTEMFYSGAEYVTSNASYFDGQVRASATNTTKAHTGIRSIAIGAGAKGFEVNMLSGEHRAGKYKISVWVEKAAHTNARINTKGTTKAFNGETVIAGNWVLKTHYEDLSSGAETVYVTSASGTVYFDDFRLHPIASSMVSYVYNEWDELWYMIGNNGLASKFEYDKAGRLIKTYTEVEDLNGVSATGGFKQISENNYNYKKPI